MANEHEEVIRVKLQFPEQDAARDAAKAARAVNQAIKREQQQSGVSKQPGGPGGTPSDKFDAKAWQQDLWRQILQRGEQINQKKAQARQQAQVGSAGPSGGGTGAPAGGQPTIGGGGPPGLIGRVTGWWQQYTGNINNMLVRAARYAAPRLGLGQHVPAVGPMTQMATKLVQSAGQAAAPGILMTSVVNLTKAFNQATTGAKQFTQAALAMSPMAAIKGGANLVGSAARIGGTAVGFLMGGPIGAAIGSMIGGVVSKVVGALGDFAEWIDGFVNKLAKFNPIIAGQQRQYERIERMANIEQAQRYTQLAESWFDFKAKILALINNIDKVLAPVINTAVRNFDKLVNVVSPLAGAVWKLLEKFGITDPTALKERSAAWNTAFLMSMNQAKVGGAPRPVPLPLDPKPVMRASGGMIEPNKWYWVGEQGPELLKSSAAGQIVSRAAASATVTSTRRAGGWGLRRLAQGGRGSLWRTGSPQFHIGNRRNNSLNAFSYTRPVFQDKGPLFERRRGSWVNNPDFKRAVQMGREGKVYHDRPRDTPQAPAKPQAAAKPGDRAQASAQVSTRRAFAGNAPDLMPKPAGMSFNQNVDNQFTIQLQSERAVQEAIFQVRERLLQSMNTVRDETLMMSALLDGGNLTRMM